MTPAEPLQPPATLQVADTDWERLIRTHQRAVLLALLARGVRPTRARELAADAWSALYERWCAGRLPVLELPGLVISHAALLQLREGRGAGRVQPLGGQHCQTDPAASPEARMAAREQLRQLEAALERCPPRARELFEAAYLHPELPHATLAQQLGVSLQRFRQSLCEVRARLRRSLEDAP